MECYNMPRPRTPLGKAELTGQAAKHPDRFRKRSEPAAEPVGPPPAYLSPDAKRAWREFCAEWPWVTRADRKALGVICALWEVIERGDAGVNEMKEFRLQCSAFGGNPTTRTKIYQPKGEAEDDPFAGFEGKAN
jgi:phage terminase small subunit